MSLQIIIQAKKIRKKHCKNLIPRSKLLKILLIKGRLIYTGTMKFSFAKFFNEFSVIFKFFYNFIDSRVVQFKINTF